MPQREAQLEQFFRTIIAKAGGCSFKMVPTVAGVPDRLVILPPGCIHFVELKTVTGRLSPLQIHWHDRLAELGVRVHVLYGPDQCRTWLKKALDGAWETGEFQREVSEIVKRRVNTAIRELI